MPPSQLTHGIISGNQEEENRDKSFIACRINQRGLRPANRRESFHQVFICQAEATLTAAATWVLAGRLKFFLQPRTTDEGKKGAPTSPGLAAVVPVLFRCRAWTSGLGKTLELTWKGIWPPAYEPATNSLPLLANPSLDGWVFLDGGDDEVVSDQRQLECTRWRIQRSRSATPNPITPNGSAGN